MNDRTLIGLDEVAAVHTGLTPLYHSLGHVIRGKIQSGEWPVEQQIPSERVLMEMFGVSRATVRQGIENLVKEGILRRIHGKGTFVAPPKIKQGLLRLLEFSDIMRRSGFNPAARLLGKERIDPPLNIRKVLALSGSEAALWLQRLLLVNDVPMLIETSYLPAARFPDLLEVYDGTDEPHLFIYKHYGAKIIRARETLEPVIMESQEAGTLGVKGGFPGLWVEHIAYDAAGKPAAFLTILLRGDRCRFYTELNDTF
jgi:GntR family transcriptional regulator